MSITAMRGRWARLAPAVLATGVLAAGLAGAAGAEGSAVAAGGKPGGPGSVFAKLTDDQRACLQAQRLKRPDGRPTAEHWRALQAAAKECGVELTRPAWAGAGKAQGQARGKARFQRLSEEQRACLTAKGLERPAGRPTVEERQALRAAAAECGIAIGGPPAARAA
ncbi:MAG: hypothetical protein ACKVUT_06135 [Gaiella sp.]